MNYSKYQLGIFEFLEKEQGHGCVSAVAGSGKTTTTVDSMTKVSPRLNQWFGCFNKTIEQTLATKIESYFRSIGKPVPSTIKIKNYNGTGMAACYKGLKNFEFDADKTINILRYTILNNLDTEEKKKIFYKIKNHVERIIGLAKGEVITDPLQLAGLIPQYLDKFDIEIKIAESEFIDYCIQVYRESLNNKMYVDFGDQLLFPVIFDFPIRRYDIIFIDEFQDTNKVQFELVKKSINPFDGRLIVIGDPWQSIYSFTGCIPDGMKQFTKEFGAKELPLSICYRCSKEVVREAQKIVKHIEYWENAKEGCVESIDTPKYQKLVTTNDMVLCRTTAPLVKKCLEKIRNNIPAYIKGQQIGDNTIEFIEKLDPSNRLSIVELAHKLKEYNMKEASRLEAMGRDNQVLFLNDKCDIVQAIIDSFDDISNIRSSDVITKVKTVFTNVDKNGICYMTIHKSKGLESKDNGNVYILRPDLLPHPKSKNQEEEARLEYVAITRAKNNLYYVQKEKSEK